MKKVTPLIIIVLIATILRFFYLGINPPSLTWDEVAWGYNAYSLGIDAKDEFGKFLPYDYLESFGDFKPPVYAYLDILPVKFFGPNEFAVRFPSALLGVLTVLITYFLVKRIFNNRVITQNSSVIPQSQGSDSKILGQLRNNTEIIALISSFLLAISPWHINLSRVAFEANVATFFLVCGVWLFLAGVQGKKWYLIFSIIFLVLSIYTFNTARIVAPVLVIILLIAFKNQIFKIKKQAFLALLIGFLILFPIFKFLFSPQASLRFKEVNIFSNISIIKESNQEIENDNNAFWSKILHNRRYKYGIEYLRHYLDNLNPNFLFIKGDGNPKFSTQDVGELYFWEFPFLIIGVLYLFKKKEGHWWIVPLWFFIGIVPAATARETPHALRIEATLPTFQILVAYGLIHIFEAISNIKYPPSLGKKILNVPIKNLIFATFFLFFIFNLLYYLHGYYFHYPREYSREWQFGYKESIKYVEKVKDNYDQIIITEVLGRPYIYYLFYTKTDPKFFRKEAKIEKDGFGFVSIESFGKYYFARDLGEVKKKSRKILYLDMESSPLPDKAQIIKTFSLLNGERILKAYIL